MKILVMGLPGAGKTTLTNELAPMIKAVVFNSDVVRSIWQDLGYSHDDRITQAHRMGLLCDLVVKSGHHAIADFICPTVQTRDAFGPAFTIWVDRIKKGRFEDTNAMFEAPDKVDLHVTGTLSPHYWAIQAAKQLK